ncbi:MAG: hypothetical protein M3460_20375 [Actinomycetota bacterium]|nr:hypothetical protein [Actinomycetota bacterium]
MPSGEVWRRAERPFGRTLINPAGIDLPVTDRVGMSAPGALIFEPAVSG